MGIHFWVLRNCLFFIYIHSLLLQVRQDYSVCIFSKNHRWMWHTRIWDHNLRNPKEHYNKFFHQNPFHPFYVYLSQCFWLEEMSEDWQCIELSGVLNYNLPPCWLLPGLEYCCFMFRVFGTFLTCTFLFYYVFNIEVINYIFDIW